MHQFFTIFFASPLNCCAYVHFWGEVVTTADYNRQGNHPSRPERTLDTTSGLRNNALTVHTFS
jgi:hypothetical protein